MTPGPRRQLIERHLPLVRAIAGRYAGAGEPLEDLVQVGAIGLIKAADRFDDRHGAPFPAYAAPFIAGEIRHHLRDRCAPVRIPRRLQAAGLRITTVDLEEAAEPAAPDHADDRLALGTALRALAPRERRLVLLRFVGDLSQAQIASRTGLSQVHVSRTLRGALSRLQEQLAEG